VKESPNLSLNQCCEEDVPLPPIGLNQSCEKQVPTGPTTDNWGGSPFQLAVEQISVEDAFCVDQPIYGCLWPGCCRPSSKTNETALRLENKNLVYRRLTYHRDRFNSRRSVHNQVRRFH